MSITNVNKPKFTTARFPVVIHPRMYEHEPFKGANIHAIQQLLTGTNTDGIEADTTRLPISPKQLIEVQLGRAGTEDEKRDLRTIDVDTSTVVLPDPSGAGLQYAREHPLIYTLTPETKLVDGCLPLTQAQYDATKNGFLLNETEINHLRENAFALPKRRREFLEYITEGDTKLAADYIEDVMHTLNRTFNHVLGLWMPYHSSGLHLFRMGQVQRQGDQAANGLCTLDSRNGCLVGVATKSKIVKKKIRDARALLEVML